MSEREELLRQVLASVQRLEAQWVDAGNTAQWADLFLLANSVEMLITILVNDEARKRCCLRPARRGGRRAAMSELDATLALMVYETWLLNGATQESMPSLKLRKWCNRMVKRQLFPVLRGERPPEGGVRR